MPAFSYSGSWESTDESWVRGSTMTRRDGFGRTGSYGLGPSANTQPYADYTILAATAGGTTITAGVYTRAFSASLPNTINRKIQYKIGAGSFTDLATVTNKSETWALLSGEFANPGSDDVVIRLITAFDEDEQLGLFDDWSIAGVVAGPTGELAATETGADTFAGVGTSARPMALAATETGTDTFSGIGAVPVAGAIAATEAGSDAAEMVAFIDLIWTPIDAPSGDWTTIAAPSGSWTEIEAPGGTWETL